MRDSLLSEIYQHLITNPLSAFWLGKEGCINIAEIIPNNDKILPLSVYPGSFNPLHDAHRCIFNYMPGKTDLKSAFLLDIFKSGPIGLKAYEISIERADKEFLSETELWNRCKQFEGEAPIIINRAPLFLQKIGVLVSQRLDPTFYVGYDTYSRMMSDYGTAGAMGLNAQFVVFDRKIGDHMHSLANHDGPVPENFARGPAIMNEQLLATSSTQIREKMAAAKNS